MKTISERADELQAPMRGTMLQLARAQIEAVAGSITDEAWATFLQEPEFKAQETTIDLSSSVAALGLALNEYQASVEERLATIGLGLVAGAVGETVIASGSSSATTASVVQRFDEEKSPTPAVSRYSPEPDDG